MNTLLIVIDAFDQTRIRETGNLLIPNISKLSKEGIRCNNVYSEAPYTESAVMALYGGQHTLDNGGYIKRFKDTEKLLFEVFKDSGYDVFFNALQPQCYPSSLKRGITDLYYDRGYDFDVLWRYRISYFSKLYKSGEIDEDDIFTVSELIGDTLDDALEFINDLEKDNTSVSLIKKCSPFFDNLSAHKLILKEIEQFEKSPEGYVREVLNQGIEHTIFKIPCFSQDYHKLSSFVVSIQLSKCRSICRRIKRKNLLNCLLHNKDIFSATGDAIKVFAKNKDIDAFLKSMYMIKNALFCTHLNDRYGVKAHKLKGQPSFRTLCDNFLHWLSNRNSELPYFACIHTDDAHFPETFYSYDLDSKNDLLKELALAEEYIDNPLKGAGTLVHDLSIKYIDYQVGLLVEKLKKMGMLDDLQIIVTADHGFSYSGYPIRNKDINTYFLENFKIPFWAFGTNIPIYETEKLVSSLDIPIMICKLAGIEVPKSFAGFDIFKSDRRILTMEYCGGGCPDLRRREVMLAAFDNEKMLAVKLKLSSELTWDSVCEVYYLKDDPLQKHNLVKSFNHDDYIDYYNCIKDRIESIIKTAKISSFI